MIRSLLSAFLIAILAAAPAQARIVQISSQGIMMPGYWQNGPAPDKDTGGVGNLNSATVKFAMIGRVYQKDLDFRRGAKTKNLVRISWGTQSWACAACTSNVQVDVEGVSTSASPMQPDGSILGGGSALATKLLSTMAATTWTTTPNFTAPAVVKYGQFIAVTWSFASYDSGSMALSSYAGLLDIPGQGPNLMTFNGTTWSGGSSAPPNIQLEFDDGTIGTLAMSVPFNGGTMPILQVLNSGSSPNEVGLQFQLPFNAYIDQICGSVTVADSSTTGVIELTDYNLSPIVMASVSFDGHHARSTGTKLGLSCFPIPPQFIKRNTTYVVGIKATSASAHNVTVPSILVNAQSTWDADRAGGQKFAYTQRTGTGSWAAPTGTKHSYLAFIVSAIDDGTGPGKTPVNNGL